MSAMMSEDGSEATASDGYVEALIEVIGHADRADPFRDYCTGLMMPVARKSVEPLAAVTAPSRVSVKHQSLLHFVEQAPWSDEALMARVRDWSLPRMIERGGPITVWIIHDTGFPKKGKHSVGVARQYCGPLGKEDNCQVAVSLTIAAIDPIYLGCVLAAALGQALARQAALAAGLPLLIQRRPSARRAARAWRRQSWRERRLGRAMSISSSPAAWRA
jgi:hypothetical protein